MRVTVVGFLFPPSEILKISHHSFILLFSNISSQRAKRNKNPFSPVVMQVFAAKHTASLLPYANLVDAVVSVMHEKRRGVTVCPPRTVLSIGGGGGNGEGTLLTMVGADAVHTTIKIVTVHPGNCSGVDSHSQRDAHHHKVLPVVQGDVFIMESATGRRLAHLDGTVVTARRTPSVSVVGVAALVSEELREKKKPMRLLIVGNGVQGHHHFDAFSTCFLVPSSPHGTQGSSVDPNAVRLMKFNPTAADPSNPFDLTAEDLAWADVIVTATSSSKPVIPDALQKHIRDDAVVCGMGAYKPSMAELPPSLVQRMSLIVVDDLAGATEEAGDLIQAKVDWSRVHEIANILADDASGSNVRPKPGLLENLPPGPKFFKSVGCALWDLAAAKCALLLENSASKL